MRRRNFLKASLAALAPALVPVGMWASPARAATYRIPMGAGRNPDGRLEVFAGFGSAVQHKWQHSNGGAWSDWVDLGSPTGTDDVDELKVASNADGRLEIFAITIDPGSAVYHMWEDGSHDNGWSTWQSLGGDTSHLAVGSNADGRLEVFQVWNHSVVQHRWQTSPNGGWGDWYDLGELGPASDLQVIRAADNRLQVFVLTGFAIYTIRQDPHSASGWSGWATLDVPDGGLQSLTVGMNHDGRLELFGTDTSDSVVHMWQSAGGGWSNWTGLGGSTLEPVQVASNQDGRLEIFYGGITGIFHNYQVTPGGVWRGQSSISGMGMTLPVIGTNADGRLEIFSGAFHSWQTVPNSGWSAWYPF
jgi:hypothetical protein